MSTNKKSVLFLTLFFFIVTMFQSFAQTSPPASTAPQKLPSAPVQNAQQPQTQPANPTKVVPPSPPVPAHPLPQAASSSSHVQMNFDNIELRDLIRFVSNIMGKNFVFDETVVKGKVTILAPNSISREEVFRVFETVINYYGFAAVETPEAIKVVRGTDAKGMSVAIVDTEKLTSMSPDDKIVTYVARLDYLDSNIMVGVFRPMMSRDAYLVNIPATNSLIMVDSASNIQKLKRILIDTDLPISKQLSSIKIYNVQHTIAEDLAKALQTLLAEGKKAATPKEKIFISSYPATNSLLISAPAEDMKEIDRIISEIDTLRPQVLVEAAIIEVSMARGEEFGVEWLGGLSLGGDKAIIGGVTQKGGNLISTAAGIISGIQSGDSSTVAKAAESIPSGLNVGVLGNSITYMGKQYPSLGAFIHALSTKDNINILSHPQLLTMNNEEAEIVVGSNVPYTTSTRIDSAGNPINSYDYRDVGVKLKIKPTINKNGFVHLNIQQEVTKVQQAVVQTGASSQIPAPTTLKRSTKTTVGVRNAQTIVISGLISDDMTSTDSGIPILSSIPVLGYLFGYKTKKYEKTNLLVFITPKIIYTPQQIEEISRDKKAEQDMIFGNNAKKIEKKADTAVPGE
ncbi:MAG: hypothetical protein NT010_07730 [Proteobacteria bacterium]|nr:hypothetical protein [Pseudomonadota bacterium]